MEKTAMGPLPSSELPGHRALKRRIDGAFERLEEAPSVDFKQSAPWTKLRGKIVRTMLGMGNLRDGGLIVIGIAERDDIWELTGVTVDHRATYSSDDLADYVANYISPRVEFSLVEHTYQNQVYLVIHVKPFSETPLICKRGLPSENLQKGRIYVRPYEGKPQTTVVEDATQMHELLELAAEKRARKMLEQFHRIGLPLTERSPEEAQVDDEQKFDRELEGL